MSETPAALEGHAATDALPAVVNTHEGDGGVYTAAKAMPPEWWAENIPERAESRAVGTTADTIAEVSVSKLFALHDEAVALRARVRALEDDCARLDWLEQQVVNVRKDARWGSHNLFWASPTDIDGLDPLPSDLRKQVDAARRGAQ